VPVTALAQLSALHALALFHRLSTIPLRAGPKRARKANAVFMIENRYYEVNAFSNDLVGPG
jgi:hypothetical protein